MEPESIEITVAEFGSSFIIYKIVVTYSMLIFIFTIKSLQKLPKKVLKGGVGIISV
jgi:hypothetical protein